LGSLLRGMVGPLRYPRPSAVLLLLLGTVHAGANRTNVGAPAVLTLAGTTLLWTVKPVPSGWCPSRDALTGGALAR
jgi:hypothetical protein